MLENWRDIAGWNSLYSVSDQGRVRGRTGAILRGSKAAGYRMIRLCRVVDGVAVTQDRYVHDLVMETFVGPKPPGNEVRHGPAGKLDNSVGNLSYGTRSENQRDRERDGTTRRGTGREIQPEQRKLSGEQAAAVRRERAAGATYTALAAEYGVSPGTLWRIVNGKTYKEAA